MTSRGSSPDDPEQLETEATERERAEAGLSSQQKRWRREKLAAEEKAERWNAAARVLVRVDPGEQLDAEGLEAACSDKEWRTICAAEPLEPEEIILLLPLYDPREQAGDCTFDVEKAQRAVAFFPECLRLIEGEWSGRPFRLELWQQAIVMNLFGWVRPDGLRRFREAFVEVPRKSGKTPLLAGIMLYLLIADGEPGAQVYSAAGDREQAALIYRHAAEMVRSDPMLNRACKCRDSMKLIEYGRTGSLYRALSKEAKTKHGLNVHAAIVDELHIQQGSDLVDVLTSATGSRRQPVIVYVTTRDFERVSICNEKERHADRVRRGLVEDPEFLPALWILEDYVADPKDPNAWLDVAAHRSVNPMLGISIKEDEFAREFRLAKENPRARNSFIRMRLNGRTQADIAWVPMEMWDACGGPRMAPGDDDRLDGYGGLERFIDELDLERLPCYGGLDLSSNRDLTAFVLYWPDVHAVIPWCWAPRFGAEKREQTEGFSYLTAASEGWLELTEGNVLDFDFVRAKVCQLGERFQIQSIGFDRFRATQIMIQLAGDGFEMVKVGQGFVSMSGPSKDLERLFLNGELQHGGHPLLRWCAGNVMVEEDAAGNIKPSKKKSTERIDPIVALVMAIGEAGADDDVGDAPTEFVAL